MTCAYCGARAVHMDHIVPKRLRRKHEGWEDAKVPACGECNWRKGDRCIVPMDYEPFDELPGTRPWMRWNGDPAGLREVLR